MRFDERLHRLLAALEPVDRQALIALRSAAWWLFVLCKRGLFGRSKRNIYWQ